MTNDRRKTRAAAFSFASNSLLIALKIVAGIVTGSVAILTEAAHSSIDLLASLIAFFSLRKAAEPADDSHPYGHAKLENLAAAIEGMLILVGAAVIVYESIHRLVVGSQIDSLGFGIAVVGISALTNFAVSTYLYKQARATESPALAGDAAHLRTDAWTSVGVLVGLSLVAITGIDALDSITALVVATAIVASGVRLVTSSSRVLVDEALPADELDSIREIMFEHEGGEVGAVQGFARGAGRGGPPRRGARLDPENHVRAGGGRGARLPRPAPPPRRQPPLRRHARAVPRGHDARARTRARARAPGRHPRTAARRRCADPPRAGERATRG